MGAEIIPIFWILIAPLAAFIIFRMFFTARYIAGWTATFVALVSVLPIITNWGDIYGTIEIFFIETAIAFFIGLPALVCAQRWKQIALFGLPISCLFWITFSTSTNMVLPGALVLFPWLTGLFALIFAPIMLVISSIFFVGAFIENSCKEA
jgi:hypothetical protein